MHFRSVGLALAAALFASACGESTGPAGTPTDLTVRVYVDADGSGTFNAGDVPVAGATVTATGDDGAQTSAQTDAQGAAVFAGLEPGSYALALSGAAPAGAVLATAATPVVTATSLGGAATAEFRYAYFPGSLSGTLFRDENGNTTFDAGVDLPAPGITVQLYTGGTATGTPVATTSTTAAGAFTFAGLRPGTYTVRVVAPQGVTIVDGADKTVTIPAQSPVALPIRFTGNLRIPIAQARTRATGSTVTVEGTVTAGRGQLGPRNFYIQDATGGMQVFLPSNSTAQPQLGDSVRVTGGISPFNGSIQIGTNAIVETLGTQPVPAPRSINSPEVMARTFEGQLVRVDSLTVVSTAMTGTTSANVNVRTPQGDLFQIRLENLTNVPLSTFVVGNVYAVTGVIDVFTNATTPVTPQLKPRSLADVTDNSPPTIAQVKGQTQGSVVEVFGVVTTTLGEFSVSTSAGTGNVYVQDRSGGIQVFGIPLSQGLVPGDSVRVRGTLGQFSGEVQITTPSLEVVKLGTGTVPAPQVITGAQLASRAFEGSLVRVNDLTIGTVGSQSSAASSYNVTATAPDGTVFTIRVEGRTSLERDAFTPSSVIDVVGIASAFTTGGVTVEQLKPRSPADLFPS